MRRWNQEGIKYGSYSHYPDKKTKLIRTLFHYDPNEGISKNLKDGHSPLSVISLIIDIKYINFGIVELSQGEPQVYSHLANNRSWRGSKEQNNKSVPHKDLATSAAKSLLTNKRHQGR